jgi:hypothetical protein
VYRSLIEATELREGDTLEGEGVLFGFSLAVERVFGGD